MEVVIYNFGDIVKIKANITVKEWFRLRKIEKVHAKIKGKVKGIDAYVVYLEKSSKRWFNDMRRKYGYPMRHLELEWGQFSANTVEFIIPGKDLEV